MRSFSLICFSCFCLIACNSSSEQNIPIESTKQKTTTFLLTEAQYQNAGIVLGKITQQKISDILKVTGKIDVPPQNMIAISVPLGGYLKQSHLLPGTLIQKGEVLAIMEDPQYIQLQQDFLVAKNKLLFIEKEYERQKSLQESKATSEKVFQIAQSDFLNQKIMVKAYSEKLKLIGINADTLHENNISRTIRIFSPVKGFVSKVNVNIGKYVSPTDILFELIDPNDIHLNLKVFEKDIEYIHIGQILYAYTNAQPNQKYLCKVLLVNRSVNEDGSIDVHCHFFAYKQQLIPGMFMNADIPFENKVVDVLPEEAIVRFENKNYIFIEQDNKQMLMKEVSIGITQNGYTNVLHCADLSSANIVVKGAYTLLMKVENTAD